MKRILSLLCSIFLFSSIAVPSVAAENENANRVSNDFIISTEVYNVPSDEELFSLAEKSELPTGENFTISKSVEVHDDYIVDVVHVEKRLSTLKMASGKEISKCSSSALYSIGYHSQTFDDTSYTIKLLSKIFFEEEYFGERCLRMYAFEEKVWSVDPIYQVSNLSSYAGQTGMGFAEDGTAWWGSEGYVSLNIGSPSPTTAYGKMTFFNYYIKAAGEGSSIGVNSYIRIRQGSLFYDLDAIHHMLVGSY